MTNQNKQIKEEDIEQIDENPTIFDNVKSYNKDFYDGDTNIYSRIRKSKTNLNKIEQ